MARFARFGLIAAAFAGFALPSEAQSRPSPYDVTTYPVIWTVPGERNVRLVRGTRYAGEGSAALTLDVTYPAGGESSTKWPAVVFVNGVGGKLNEWEIYKSWARLAAAHGIAGITAESDPAKPADSVRALFAYLAKNGAALNIDSSRIAAWACSANVRAALPLLMDSAPAGVRAAVILYGTGDFAALRKDLPVFWVLAGRDGPQLVEGQRAIFARAVAQGVPWTMVNAPDLPHAFDGVEDTPHSRQVVREIVEFLVAELSFPAPQPPAPAARRASAYMYANEPDKAAGVYREILASNPKDAEAQRLLGLALTRAGKTEEAIEALLKAVELGDNSPAIHRNLGDAFLRAGKPVEAAEHLERSLRMGMKPPPVIYNLACAYALSARKDDAFALLNEVAAMNWLTREQLEKDQDLSSLKSDPRFAALLAKLPQPAAASPR